MSDRLTLDYGVRFYYLTPQWDTTLQASNFLPEEFNKSAAVRLFQPSVVDGVRVGYDAITGPGGELGVHRPRRAQHRRPVPGDVPGRPGHRRDAHRRQQVQGVASRSGSPTTSPGKQTLVARGGFGVFYDRPQGNQVFDLITNPPGLQSSTLQWGLVKDVASATRLQRAGRSATRTCSTGSRRSSTSGTSACSGRCRRSSSSTCRMSGRSRGICSSSGRSTRCRTARPTCRRARTRPAARPARVAPRLSTTPGANALPTDLLRSPIRAIRRRPHVGVLGLLELQGPADHHQPPVHKGLMFSANYTRSSAKGIAGGDWDGARIDGKDREANYGPLGQDRPHIFVVNFVYQTPKFKDRRAGLPHERLAVLGRLPLGVAARRTASATRSPASAPST